MPTLTVGWRPFSIPGHSKSEVNKKLIEAMKQMSTISGLRVVGSSTPQVYVFGCTKEWAESTFPNLRNVPWSAFAYNGASYHRVDLKRPNLRWMREEFQHEWGHLLGLGHVNNGSCMMSPSASNKDFWCPSEVLWFQGRFGRPSKPFAVPGMKEMRTKVRRATELFNKKRVSRDKSLREFRRYRDLYRESRAQDHKDRRDMWLKQLRNLNGDMNALRVQIREDRTYLNVWLDQWKSVPGSPANSYTAAVPLSDDSKVVLEPVEAICYGELDV